MFNKIIAGAVILLAIGLGIVYFSQPSPQVIEKVIEKIGAFPGPDIDADINIHGNLTYGTGEYIATSSTVSGGTTILKYSDLDTNLISYTQNVGNYTLQLPATSTMFQFLPTIGSTRKWIIHNATTTAGSTLTITKGAGIDLVSVTTDDDVIDGGEFTQLSCTRIPYLAANNENIVCIVDELLNSD